MLGAPSSTFIKPAALLFRGHVHEVGDREAAVSSEDYGAMTVAELKDALRAKGLPVSGRKAELVERLLAMDTAANSGTTSITPPLSESPAAGAAAPIPMPMGTVEVDCGSCGQRLSLPASHTGRFQCPSCGTEQDMAVASLSKQDPMEALSDQYASARALAMRLNVAGIVVGVLAILVFFSAVSQFGPDPEDCTEIEYEGEMVLSCTGSGTVFDETGAWSTLGVACCLLVPLAISLPIVAQAVRPPPLVKHQATYGQHGTSGQHEAEAVVEWDSPIQRLIGAVSLLFGGSLVLATVVLAIGIVVLFVLALMALGSMG